MIKTRAQTDSIESEFVARINKIRARVALKLAHNIQQTDAALPQMAGDGDDAVDAVATAYRWLHNISGIGPTLGFPATGQQARACAAIVIGPFRTQRGLSPDELALLTSGLESLRIAALSEMHRPELVQR